MFNKNNLLIAGLSAAAVTVLSVGGYLIHKKILKHRLQEQVRRQAMGLAFFDLASGKFTPEDFEDFDYSDYEDEDSDYIDYEDEYLNGLLGEFDGESTPTLKPTPYIYMEEDE